MAWIWELREHLKGTAPSIVWIAVIGSSVVSGAFCPVLWKVDSDAVALGTLFDTLTAAVGTPAALRLRDDS